MHSLRKSERSQAINAASSCPHSIILPANDLAVSAGVGAAPQHTVRHAANNLAAPKVDAVVVALRLTHLVAPPLQIRYCFVAEPFLQVYHTVVDGGGADARVDAVQPESWGIQSFLRFHPVIHHPAQYLHMPLWLHKASHHAEGAEELLAVGPLGGGGSGDDGVEGALVGRQAVGVIRVQNEVGPPILQREAASFADDTGSEAHVVGVDEAAAVAIPVHGAEVHGVVTPHRELLAGLHQRRSLHRDHLVRVAAGSPLGSMLLAEQRVQRHVHHVRVGPVLQHVSEGQAHG
mmetsp:Transcript_5504/g.15779  ORF Transcript_5504/g.15779 Transcript_5504/m.15779 type:complete len:290 (+) Transcript_5504:508-1377(+)